MAKHASTAAADDQQTVKKRRKMRNEGKLAALVHMPLDIFFEIMSKLAPLDILQISRVSKEFRFLVTGQKSRHIWVTARRNLPVPMPDCPSDMTEAQYAAFAFEVGCQLCGGHTSKKWDASLRLRYCGRCFRDQVRKGSAILRAKPWYSIDDIWTLVPRSIIHDGWRPNSRGVMFDNYNNSKRNCYHATELKMVADRYTELMADEDALQKFVNEQRAIASQIMQHAAELWTWRIRSIKEDNADEIAQEIARRTAVQEKLVEMGWDKKYFPSDHSWDWRYLLTQKRPLTDKVWATLYQKLEPVLTASKDRILAEERRVRTELRKEELRPLFDGLITRLSSECTQRWPSLDDACAFATLHDTLFEEESTVPFTEDRWRSVLGPFSLEVKGFELKQKRDIVKLLQGPDGTSSPAATDDSDLKILDRASSLLRCARCLKLFGYPALLEHMGHCGQLSWCKHRFQPLESSVSETVSAFLKFLDLPDDTPHKLLAAMGSRFLCLCGNPKFCEAMDFNTLVLHIESQNRWHAHVTRERRQHPDHDHIQICNDHDFAGPLPLIGLLPKGEDSPTPSPGSPVPFVGPHDKAYCALCARASRHEQQLKTMEELQYHMKAKHARDEISRDLVMNSFQTMISFNPGLW
ncbi:hypothetical protein PLICRDRAFT_509418 [Plicaturopsis crispa FD-325 SS-3]|nr:hypothetical protein PLICRDRAFT_509418 [Plicaturopsis crispa FD-325 SS-3]